MFPPPISDDGAAPHVALTLFVSGASDVSTRAVTQANRLCETHLEGSYDLSVVDVYANPAAVITHRVLVTPTLLRTSPSPTRRFVGDLSRVANVLSALELSVGTLRPIALS